MPSRILDGEPQGHVILKKLANIIDFRFVDVCVQST